MNVPPASSDRSNPTDPSGSRASGRLLVAVETSGPVGSVAAAIEGEVVVERSFERGMRHGRDLVPHLADLCRQIGREPEAIDVVAVSVGPGSYTGVRVGVTCAKTLAFILGWARAGGDRGGGVSLVAVSTLEVLARNAPEEEVRVAVVVDARRGCFYAALFQRSDGLLRRCTADLLLTPEGLAGFLPRGVLVVGDAVLRQPRIFEGLEVRLGDEGLAVARAGEVARLGWRDYLAGRTVPPHDLVPVYLRRPEAVERLEERLKGHPRT